MTRRNMLLVGLLGVFAAAGCRNNTEGPREIYWKNRSGDRADLPGYSIEQQKQRGRERYSIVEDDRNIAPPVFMSRPDPVGR